MGDGIRGVASAIAAGLLTVAAGAAYGQVSCEPCRFGVVLDGPWERNDEVRKAFEEEIADLAAPRFTVAFPGEKRRVADWTAESVRRSVKELLADPDVDLVLTLGPVGSMVAAAQPGALSKPVVAAFVVHPEAHGIPVETTAAGERVSGASNLHYVNLVADPTEEWRRFREVAPFTHIAYLVNSALLTAAPRLEANLQSVARLQGLDLTVVPVGASGADAIAALPPGVEAVYVTPLVQLAPADFDRLVRVLIGRRLPTFSFWGRSEVDRGLLMSLHVDIDFRRIGRRIALGVQRILAGEEAGAIPVDFRRNRRLTLNMATARAIGVIPGWSVLTEAEILRDEPADVERRLDLASVVREAVAVNLDLASADRSVAAGRQQALAARAALLPQLFLSGVAETIDGDRSAHTFGLQPRWFSAASLGMSQVIYSDGARAAAEIERDLQASRRESRHEVRLDVAHAAAVGYLGVLRTKILEQIQRENLTVTRTNLDLARTRRLSGVARASEVVRWEYEIANNRRASVDATSRRRVAEMALNRVLNRPLEEPFATTGVDLNNPALLATAETVETYAGDPVAFARFRDFITQEGLAISPELAQIDAAVSARERTVLAARRALWAPEVVATGELAGRREAVGGLAFPPDAGRWQPPKNAFDWRVGVAASVPLFNGGARRAQRSRAEHELDELRLVRRAAAERVEQRIRTALHLAGASFLGIGFAAEAAGVAQRNLDLVGDAYEQGGVGILDVLDAQHTAFLADLAAANAVHDFLTLVMDVHRAMGRFGFLMSAAELTGFAERMQRFFAEPGGVPPGEAAHP